MEYRIVDDNDFDGLAKAMAGAEKILKYFEDNKHLLKDRPMCHHHGDYHTGNIIIDSGNVWIIDWHTMDFDDMENPVPKWYRREK